MWQLRVLYKHTCRSSGMCSTPVWTVTQPDDSPWCSSAYTAALHPDWFADPCTADGPHNTTHHHHHHHHHLYLHCHWWLTGCPLPPWAHWQYNKLDHGNRRYGGSQSAFSSSSHTLDYRWTDPGFLTGKREKREKQTWEKDGDEENAE